MNSKDIYNKFNEISKDNTFSCTQSELDEFIMYGLVFKTNDTYVNRNKQLLDIDIIKPINYRFTLDFTGLIQTCTELGEKNNCKKIYCMNSRCYNKYKKQGLIIEINNIEYYRLFDKDLWLVNIIN